MGCPFLQEAHVRYCTAYGIRKMIAEPPAGAGERCISIAHRDCDVYRGIAERDTSNGPCPYLKASLAQFCSASPMAKLVPYSDQAGRCASDGWQFCSVYLSMARPFGTGGDTPSGFFFAPNHMWLFPGAHGVCHVGVDAFLARLAGQAEAISFLSPCGARQPAAVLSFRGVDCTLAFPQPLLITGANLYLRHAPRRLAEDPYGAGWLYECQALADTSTGGLLEGAAAADWMRSEWARLTERVHLLASERHPELHSVLNDGGAPAENFLNDLSRDELLRLLHEFVGPQAGPGWSKE